ncbi:MAG: hypothetical protein LBF50_04400, partial [Azoarcus sp.]|nr:hypothetical protein [Azoarcus sp.]MDR0716641.1 hypothetical protein [Azoarcus sp.]
SAKRIHQATDTLENRVEELKQSELTSAALIEELADLQAGIRRALEGATVKSEKNNNRRLVVVA